MEPRGRRVRGAICNLTPPRRTETNMAESKPPLEVGDRVQYGGKETGRIAAIYGVRCVVQLDCGRTINVKTRSLAFLPTPDELRERCQERKDAHIAERRQKYGGPAIQDDGPQDWEDSDDDED